MTFDTVNVAGSDNCKPPRRAPSHARLLPAILQPGKHHTSVTVESEPTRTLTVIACCVSGGAGGGGGGVGEGLVP